jgi:acyl carrier protein
MSIDLLKKVFTESLGLTHEADWDNLAYRGIEEWDSVAHMQLVGEIEDAFDVMLETQEVIAMSSFTEAVRILRQHGADVD